MKKKKLKTWVKVLIHIILLSAIIYLGLFIYGRLDTDNKNDNKKQKVTTKSTETKKESNMLSMVMVGDCLIHRFIYNDASNGDGTYSFDSMFDEVAPLIKGHDLAFYNQESIIGGKSLGLSAYPRFNSPEEIGDTMVNLGFNLVSLATNHTLDRGEQAIINSRDYWNSKDNVLAVGSYSSNEEKDEIHILKKNNITYTMLNYTYGTNGIKVPSNKEYLVNVWPCTGNDPSTDTKYQEYKKTVKEDIEKVRDKVDLLIVAIHWGIEYKYTPNEYQKDMASYLASLGVNIIIGTHPHVVEPITYIDNTLVIYSLGNFVSAQDTVEDYNTRVGLLSTVTINKDSNNNISLSDLNNELIFTTDSSNSYKVIPFSNPDIKTYLNDYERVYNKYSSIVKSIDDTIKINSLSS